MLYDWDWAGAEAAFAQALALDPGYATAHHWHGMLLAARGRLTGRSARWNARSASSRCRWPSAPTLASCCTGAPVRRSGQSVSGGHRSRSDVHRRAHRHPDGLRRDGDAPAAISGSCARRALSREAAAALESAFARGVRGYWRAFLSDLADAPSSEVHGSPYVRRVFTRPWATCRAALQWLETARDVRDAGLSLLRWIRGSTRCAPSRGSGPFSSRWAWAADESFAWRWPSGQPSGRPHRATMRDGKLTNIVS